MQQWRNSEPAARGVGGWWIKLYDTLVDITPRGEEDQHIPDRECECGPRLSQDDEGRLMIIHNSYDGREAFERAEAALPRGYRRRAA